MEGERDRRMGVNGKVTELLIRDVRFPTSLEAHGSDAMHKDPDYSAAYVVIKSDGTKHEGHGLTFTVGRGTEIVVSAVKSLSRMVVGCNLADIFGNFAGFWRDLTSESQLRWVGPEKGVIHLATAAVVNALWDLWAKIENKPLWKLLSDMTPEEIVSTIDFRYLSDALTKEEALQILRDSAPHRQERIKKIREVGYPAYTTSCAWLGYSDETLTKLAHEALREGFTRFKVKVGSSVEDDKRRLTVIRNEIGWDNMLMVDANQKWDVQHSIDYMAKLAHFKLAWIEEPTSPDDVLGHLAIKKGLSQYGIGVATGEQCANRVLFKQFLQSGAIDFCQIDAARVGGVNEILSVILMAKKFNVPVCPHGGGVGLCEYVQHLSIFDYICVSGSLENRVIEYVDHLHEHFLNPCVVNNGCYVVPEAPGYSIEMKPNSLAAYEYPDGPVWADLRLKGLIKDT
ncbi:mitochondrial enolase superfamily member 1-like [Corticium candelabrum]|uniref:mitochondrial enolase superfamily member 1-like n=1 Tax=Corticium candelabrum TaxID=121492 RepID=UPI002E262933|nr:mitochondrial enolase superfamily member 1-like [Corticium candelabrum]